MVFDIKTRKEKNSIKIILFLEWVVQWMIMLLTEIVLSSEKCFQKSHIFLFS